MMSDQSAGNAGPLPTLPARRPESHKGDYGRALLIGGSRGMSGAIGLAGMAALRGGAGLVKLAVPDVCQDVVAGYEPSYMTLGLPSDEAGRLTPAAREMLDEPLSEATAVALGPGLGRSAGLSQLVARLYRDLPQPMVVDADALFALSQHAERLESHAGPRILTPHAGEFDRLTGRTDRDVAARRQAARELAREIDAVVLLKGHRTLVAAGERAAENATGNPGMATGGAGDVLTGLLVALLCQGLAPFDAARLAAHVHGLAGDIAADELGETALTASDLVDCLPEALETVVEG